jgi:hypothetical protein
MEETAGVREVCMRLFCIDVERGDVLLQAETLTSKKRITDFFRIFIFPFHRVPVITL